MENNSEKIWKIKFTGADLRKHTCVFFELFYVAVAGKSVEDTS